MSGAPHGARVAPSAARNRAPIEAALRLALPDAGTALEIASGSGEHALWFAGAFPDIQWRPSDVDDEALASIEAWRQESGPTNLLAAIRIDAAEPSGWPAAAFDAVVCINMIHISPWRATQGLIRGAAQALKPGGALFLYGPYLEDDRPTAPSNEAFDQSLKARDPAWGLRRLEAVTALAAAHGFTRERRIEMPANNLGVVFRLG